MADYIATLNAVLPPPKNLTMEGQTGMQQIRLVPHNDLNGRDVADAHPIESITNLQSILDSKTQIVRSDVEPTTDKYNTLWVDMSSTPSLFKYYDSFDNSWKAIQGGSSVDLSEYQKKIDDNLTTTSKEVVLAINENKASVITLANNTAGDLAALQAGKRDISDSYSKTEIDSKIGDIDSILDAINGEVL